MIIFKTRKVLSRCNSKCLVIALFPHNLGNCLLLFSLVLQIMLLSLFYLAGWGLSKHLPDIFSLSVVWEWAIWDVIIFLSLLLQNMGQTTCWHVVVVVGGFFLVIAPRLAIGKHSSVYCVTWQPCGSSSSTRRRLLSLVFVVSLWEGVGILAQRGVNSVVLMLWVNVTTAYKAGLRRMKTRIRN